MEYYSRAREGGRADGSFALAACYENGRGVKADREKALALYNEAAQRGEKRADAAIRRLSSKKARKFPWQKK